MMKKVKILGMFLILFSTVSTAQDSEKGEREPWAYPYEVKKVVMDGGVELAYVDEGAGEEVLLFVHGLGSNLQAWKKNIDQLRSSHRCIAVDLPGYGKSSKGDYPQTMTFFASVLEAFISHLGISKVNLVGHSMGGQVAIHTVLRGNGPVERLILMAPAGFEEFSGQESLWFKTVTTPELIKATTDEQIIQNFKLNFFEMPGDAEFMIEDRLALKASPDYDHYCGMIPKCVAGMLDEPVSRDLDKIEVPTMVFFGKNDMLIPNRYLHPNKTVEQVARSGADRMAESTLVLVDKAGHFVQWDGAVTINEGILDFLSK
jgi:pimeloyl-ACP methyl ester carboxylesterase